MSLASFLVWRRLCCLVRRQFDVSPVRYSRGQAQAGGWEVSGRGTSYGETRSFGGFVCLHAIIGNTSCVGCLCTPSSSVSCYEYGIYICISSLLFTAPEDTRSHRLNYIQSSRLIRFLPGTAAVMRQSCHAHHHTLPPPKTRNNVHRPSLQLHANGVVLVTRRGPNLPKPAKNLPDRDVIVYPTTSGSTVGSSALSGGLSNQGWPRLRGLSSLSARSQPVPSAGLRSGSWLSLFCF